MRPDTQRRLVVGGLGAAAVMALLRDNHAASLGAHGSRADSVHSTVQPLIPNRLYRIGCTVRAERLSWLATDAPDTFEPLNAYLLVDREHAVFVDTGSAIMLPAVQQALQTIVGERRVWLSYTRNEADCIGNLGWILGSCSNPTLLFGGAGGILEWINDPAVSIMEVRDFLGRVPIVESRNGMSSRIGDIELQWFDAGIKQMLMTQWMFEPESGCMFTSDCFGFRHLTRADAIPIVDSKRGIPKIPRIAEELAARMNWLRGAEFPEVVARFETLFRERDVRMIAPVHGCVIRGRDAVRAHVAAMLSALRVTSQLPSLEETRYD